jgi:hypothetical protein
MNHAKAIGRLSILAVGLGIGAAAAATSPTAAADPGAPANPLPLIPDLLVPLDAAAVPAAPMDIAISVDGIPLVQSGSAVADSGFGDIAIAMGAGSTADAGSSEGSGLFDTAFANGIGATATSGGGSFDSATANGDGSNAFAADGIYNSAFASGTNSDASASGFSDNLSSFDSASAVGTNAFAESGVIDGFSGQTGGDIATVFDPSGTVGSTAEAGNGFFDLGAALSDGVTSTGAVGGSFLVDIVP